MSDVQHCYMTAAQTVCVTPGDPLEPAYAASQERYIGHPEPTVKATPTTTTTDPTVEMVCFLTAGQRPCFPVGSPEAEAAALVEAEYNSIRFPTTTTTHSEEVESGLSLAERAPSVTVVQTPTSTTAVLDEAPTTTLPATGADATILAAAFIVTSLGVAARRVALRS